MATYRDDHQDNAIVADGVWLKTTNIVIETAKAVSGAIIGLSIVMGDVAQAYDGVNDRAYTSVGDTAVAIDNAFGAVAGQAIVGDTLKSNESYRFTTQAMLGDTATALDDIAGKTMIIAKETAVASDGYILKRISKYWLGDTAKGKDGGYQYAKEIAGDTAAVFDNAKATSILKSMPGDTVTARDGIAEGINQQAMLGDTAKASDDVESKATFANHITDWVMAEDGTSDSHQYGQAWTANTETWAMSRYQPYSYDGLVVIDGKLYGTNDDGVHELNVINKPVTGQITTGKMDLTGGSLSYPIGAYLEYELGGQDKQAIMAVTQTQKGISQTYRYKLPTEQADELTNGRFVFGRGLRGRHFTVALTITGTHGHINDMSVDVATGKRRV